MAQFLQENKLWVKIPTRLNPGNLHLHLQHATIGDHASSKWVGKFCRSQGLLTSGCSVLCVVRTGKVSLLRRCWLRWPVVLISYFLSAVNTGCPRGGNLLCQVV